MDKWDHISAKKAIERNGGKIKGKVIYFPKAGIKMLGAIDYLVNYCGYTKG